MSNDRKYKYASDRIVSLQYESTQLETICKVEEQEIEKLEVLIEAIDRVVAANDEGRLELSKAASAFRQIKVTIGLRGSAGYGNLS